MGIPMCYNTGTGKGGMVIPPTYGGNRMNYISLALQLAMMMIDVFDLRFKRKKRKRKRKKRKKK